mgnify:CR=1 FL=1
MWPIHAIVQCPECGPTSVDGLDEHSYLRRVIWPRVVAATVLGMLAGLVAGSQVAHFEHRHHAAELELVRNVAERCAMAKAAMAESCNIFEVDRVETKE